MKQKCEASGNGFEAKPSTWLFQLKAFMICVCINMIAGSLILPPHASEIDPPTGPGATSVMGFAGFTIYLMVVRRFFPRYWCSTGVAVANSISVGFWSYVMWDQR